MPRHSCCVTKIYTTYEKNIKNDFNDCGNSGHYL